MIRLRSCLARHHLGREAIGALLLSLGLLLIPAPASAQKAEPPQAGFDAQCRDAAGGRGRRVVCADLVALDQMLVYNRFGSFNPYGMIFALRRDVVPMALEASPAQTDCAQDTATHEAATGPLAAGEVRLHDCRRPRPLVLRANVGDLLYLHVTNLLAPAPANLSSDFCAVGGSNDPGRAAVAGQVSRGDDSLVAHGEALCPDATSSAQADPELAAPDWPSTRSVNMVIQGLMPLALPGSDAPHPACFGLDAVAPDDDFACLYEVVQEGTHFMSSRAAPAGGEGDGGSITHGLFGAVMAERPGTRWYRSQVSQAAMDAVWTPRADAPRHSRDGALDYEGKIGAMPVLNLARALDGAAFRDATAVELVHADLNAVIWCDAQSAAATADQPLGCAAQVTGMDGTVEPVFRAFREFSVFFHDELKSFYTRNFEELAQFGQFAGVRDGFAINYGASGMGSLLLANRKGIGPSAACMECLYEEFFLTSWANGDPALLEWYADDPSNVHHSYLNDPVVFRNFHAGPKETHVFHLHAHQWFAGNDPSRGSYLDSQTVAPGQGFTYNIYHGGRKDGNGGPFVAGSGNRNRTVGDSIFHCHLYPHFAQGMWALWRVHDVFEDGSRKLPDGQATPGLSADIRDPAEAHFKRLGSVDPETGAWLEADDPATPDMIEGAGTPIPALVPLPGEALPPLPSYADPSAAAPEAADEDQAALRPDAGPAPRRTMATLPGRAGRPTQFARRDALGTGPERLIRAQATTAAPEAEAATTDVPDEPPADTPAVNAMPGYPFYIAGEAGHRPPQAPRDIARKLDANGAPTGELLSGGVGRHVITQAERKVDFLSDETLQRDADLAAALDQGDNRQKLETLRSQIVAKALALGDMTAHLDKAAIRLLDPEGTPLERAAQDFHHDGGTLSVLQPDGNPASASEGGYTTLTAPLPDASDMPPSKFQVNGAPGAPGAPYADPCGGAPVRDGAATANDPFVGATGYVTDPNLLGFRRYEVSAVQLDLVVNQAGWHDPQARIDVLTAGSDAYKDSGVDSRNRISPTVRDDSEPFFFRAVTGECIEFRHTNELPKDLELDDFQVKTPTDTIGQHIHLVKFDVTASDGSGNGWNYEDGTFAADELMARRCANLHSDDPLADDAARGFTAATQAMCDAAKDKGHVLSRIWRLPMGNDDTGAPHTVSVEGMAPIETRDLFQTTVQRWFADPILSKDGAGTIHDRTMRTVFSHDHFGPSSIQQHGFYTALLIEPKTARVCDPRDVGQCTEKLAGSSGSFAVAHADEDWVGSHKVILADGAKDPFHPDYREFALAIADFAVLYDPRDRAEIAALDPDTGDARKGMAQLNCEAQLAAAGRGDEIASRCGDEAMDAPIQVPAWWAAGAPGDDLAHQQRLNGNLMRAEDADRLREHLISYRSRAASPDGVAVDGPVLAQPVAPPLRPESISVDHHDPYLVNYRNAPIPLRLATKNADGTASADCAPLPMTPTQGRGASGADSDVVRTLMAGQMPQCSYRYQLAGLPGDAAYALSSWAPDQMDYPRREPETPRFEGYQDERLMFRLIQGAQEVQHSFNIAGVATSRNIDQRFPRGMHPLAVTTTPERQACFDAVMNTRPDLYEKWLNNAPAQIENAAQSNSPTPEELDYFAQIDEALANCDNLDGYTFAQEVGISEHFELRGRLRSDLAVIESVPAQPDAAAAADAGAAGIAAASDYLYNFGTVDALWNGAWGLLRVYEGETERQQLIAGWRQAETGATTDPADDAITALPSVSATRKTVEASGGPAELAPLAAAAGCPLPTDPQAGNNTAFLIVALRTDDAFPGGTDYGGHRNDPDGLMLAALNPDSLTLPGRQLRDMRNNADWTGANSPRVAEVLRAVRSAYQRPEPLAIRVNAGDCVSVRYLNILSEGSDGAGLPDQLGDALLPPIAPLNSDPQPAVQRTTTLTSTRVDGTLSATTTPATGLRPSARLGLSIGLPGGDLIRDLPLGYGINGAPLAPASGGRATVSQELRFYAGRMRIASGEGEDFDLKVQVAADTVDAMQATLAEWIPDHGEAFMAAKAIDGEPPHFAVLGTNFVVLDAVLTDEQRLLMQVMATSKLQRYTRWIPYAFGPVPVRVTGDMISQTPHGLFGVIDVVPRDWLLPVELVPPMEVPATDDRLIDRLVELGLEDDIVSQASIWRSAAVAPNFGAPARIARGDNQRTIREFVIFYQDGLNHHDERSRINWSLTNEDGSPANPAGLPRITPDCPICDDSYDRGDQGVSYRSRPFASLLRFADIAGNGRIEASDDLNAITFPNRFFAGQSTRSNGADHTDPELRPLTMLACPGEQVVIRAVHPGGRARQRAFALNGMGYDDLFPGFGFPNAALLAPVKSVSAWLHPPTVLGESGDRQPTEGTVLWHDGPTYLMAGGTWGLVSYEYGDQCPQP